MLESTVLPAESRSEPPTEAIAFPPGDCARLEGVEKVTGRARYSADVRLPEMLWASVLRSPLPHARIRSIRTNAARALPGVHAVLTCENTPAIPWYDHGKLFDRTVRFVGDEVAAVAADSPAIAVQALALIEVDYEPLSFALDLAAALAADAPRIHGGERNLVEEPRVDQRGHVRRGMREAELIIDRVYTTQIAHHACLEPHGCVAAWNGSVLTLYASTQGIGALREEVAEKLGMESRDVRIITEHMGGGFGSKQVAWKHDVIAALLAKEARRPVYLVLDREAESVAVGNRNATRQHVRIGAKRDGTLTAITAEIDIQIGAYRAGGEDSIVDWVYHSTYACRNVRTEQSVVYTNTGPAIAFRAPGYVEGAFALESAMDELARALSLDPIELRLKNYTEIDQRKRKPYTLPEALRACYASVSRAFGWKSYPRPTATGAKRRGIGFAAHDWVGGSGHPPGKVRVALGEDGRFRLETGAQDIGTGTRTALAQICASTLGIGVDQIEVQIGDTDVELPAPVSAGSATLATLGPAVQSAAAQAKALVFDAAAAALQLPVETLALESGRIVAPVGAGIGLAELAKKHGRRSLRAAGKRTSNRRSHAIRTCGAQCVEVEVDVETGEVRILRVVAAHDCGRIINRRLVDSQVIGGITQGLGFALLEGRVVDARSGVVLNANLEDYKIPTIADTPEIVHAAIDLPDTAANSTGAKGIGEPPIIPVAPAIANAIFDAVGIRLYNTPISTCSLLDALSGPPYFRVCDREEPTP